MKKFLLFFLGFATWTAQSQIEIRIAGETANVSGTTITEEITTNHVPVGSGMGWERAKFHVYNLSGLDEQFRLKRVRVSVPSDWSDEICWPPSCYPTSGVIYLTPQSHAPTILSGGSTTDVNGGMTAEIKPVIVPGAIGSSATYRYILTDVSGDIHYDSVTLVLNYGQELSVSTTQKTTELTMSPNPASDFVSIDAEGITDGKIRVVDVLGNVVYTGEFNNAKKLNLADFKNGVYFITVQSSSNKGITKKLVVRH